MKRSVTFFGMNLIVLLWSGHTMASGSDYFCEITASAEFATGDVLDGSASDINPGVETIDWMHDATGFSFETMAADANGIECRLNGATTADVIGTGIATVDGDPGYGYFIELEDNRPAPSGSIVLVASISFRPTDRTEGIAEFATPQPVVIPSELPVTAGGSGNGWTRLHLDDITCRYRGTGATYGFVRCTDPLDSGYVAGDTLAITNARLRIQQADRDLGTAVVEAEIAESIPAPGAPDFYSILIIDPSGAVFYDFSGAVEDGDIDIMLLDPVP